MENATKALLMAGAILIAMLIMSSFVLFFGDLNKYEKSKTDATIQEQVVKFNNAYTAYDRDNITLNEIKNLYNKIIDNNENAKNGEMNYYKIETNIKALCKVPQKKGEQEIDITTTNFKELDDRLKNNKYSFKCIEIEFSNEGGRVSKMFFEMTDLTKKPMITYNSAETD